MFEIVEEIEIKHLDPGYNHLNHTQAIALMEKARLRFLESIGYPNCNFHSNNLFLVVTELTARFLREILIGKITVTIDSGEAEEKDLILTQRILSDKGKECVTAVFNFKFISGVTKRSARIPDDFKEKVKEFFTA